MWEPANYRPTARLTRHDRGCRTQTAALLRPATEAGPDDNLIGNRPENPVLVETFQDAGTDAEIAAVQLQFSGLHPLLDPWKRHQIVEREAHRLVLTDVLPVLRRRAHCALTRRFGDAHPAADEVRHF